MSTLAIRGHKTRGEEVIHILEMLGGKNQWGYKGDRVACVYYLNNDTIINYTSDYEEYVLEVFTLEEFIEKFPYKIGDRVRVYDFESEVRIDDMNWDGFEIQYNVFSYESEWYSAQELNGLNMKEQAHLNQKVNLIKEEIKENLQKVKEIIKETIRMDIPIGYEFVGIDNDNQQVIFNKIQIKYPTTYEECCEVLGLGYKENKVNVIIYNIEHGEAELYRKFIELKRCRDAYWKLYGKQIGLKEPWKPIHESLVDNDFYTICCFNNEVSKGATSHRHSFLEFPTEEMRDMFFNNFKDIIEFCKELI